MKNSGGRLAVFFVLVLFILAWTTENGKLNLNLRYETEGQKHWFATPDGTGDCSDWDHACTFTVAASKCSDDVQDVIWLGAGCHDTDNGVDGTGLTIDKDFVRVTGISCSWSASTKICNGDAAATKVLTVTGNSFQIDTVYFSNTGQPDENVIFLNLNGVDGAQVNNCRFVQDPATATSGTGVLVEGGSVRVKFENDRASFIQGTAFDIDNGNAVLFKDTEIVYSTTGIDIGDNLDFFEMVDVSFDHCTTGVVVGSGTDNMKMNRANFVHNTTNISYGGVFDGLHYENLVVSHPVEKTYPTQSGTTITTGNGAWTWTAAPTNIIPASTISNPFIITGINVQDYDASQTYKIELLYGAASPETNQIGIYEFTVGTTIAGLQNPISFPVRTVIPANASIGVKTMSSTGGTDDIDITLSYEEF